MFWLPRRRLRQPRGFRKREIKIINKPFYENPYFQRKKPGFILRHLKNPKRVILILIFLGLIYILFYSKYLGINMVEIKGNQELTYDRIRYEINKAFVVRRFIIFRQSNIFIYDKEREEENLKNNLVLDEIKIKKRLPNKIIVTLKEKIPNLTLISKDKYYYLDLTGLVTHEVKKEEVKESFPKVEDLNKREVKLKDQILSEKIIKAIFELKENFSGKTNTNIDKFLIPIINCPPKTEKMEIEDAINKNANQTINSNLNLNAAISSKNTNLKINLNANNNLNSLLIEKEECDLASLTHDITVKTTDGWEAFFATSEEISNQLERLKIYLLRKALNKESLKNLIYIDLRFGEKIYVKEK